MRSPDWIVPLALGRYKCVGSRRKFSRVDCLDNVSMLLSRMTERTPAELGYRMPAEWERHEATWLSWPRREGISFPGSFDRVLPALRAMVAALIESERVCINVCNGAHEAEAMEVLRDLDPARITFHRIPTNEPWCRDHGPIFLTRNKQPRLAIVDWDYNAWGGKYPPCDLDEVVPTRVGEILDVPVFYPRMILEGGSIEVNGTGALLTSESCLLNENRNPNLKRDEIEQRLRDYLGVREVLWLGQGIEGDDTDGHIDDLARFVRERVVVTVVEEKRDSPNYQALQENLARLAFDENRGRAAGSFRAADAEENRARRFGSASELRQFLHR